MHGGDAFQRLQGLYHTQQQLFLRGLIQFFRAGRGHIQLTHAAVHPGCHSGKGVFRKRLQIVIRRAFCQSRQHHIRCGLAFILGQQLFLCRQSAVAAGEIQPSRQRPHHVIHGGQQHVACQKQIAVPIGKVLPVDSNAHGVNAIQLCQRQSHTVIGNGQIHTAELAVAAGKVHTCGAA